MRIDYRGHAQKAIQQAHDSLHAGGEAQLRSAALHLRMAMEALTYDRMQVYADEVPPEEYATWQPKRVMDLLLEIDANADSSSSLSVGTEEAYGVPPKEMHFLGTEKVLDLATIKKHYDALGSHLHIPTLRQMQDGKSFDADKLRARCRLICDALESVLSSSIRNIRFAVVSQMDCLYCGKRMRKRAPTNDKPRAAKCFECGAVYQLISAGSQVRWEPLQVQVVCPTEGCDHEFVIGNHEVKLGAHLTCPACHERYVICYGIKQDLPVSEEPNGEQTNRR